MTERSIADSIMEWASDASFRVGLSLLRSSSEISESGPNKLAGLSVTACSRLCDNRQGIMLSRHSSYDCLSS